MAGEQEPSTDSDRCDACGRKFANHLGLIGTCRRLKMLRVQVQNLLEDMNSEPLATKAIKARLDKMVRDAQ